MKYYGHRGCSGLVPLGVMAHGKLNLLQLSANVIRF